jgi:hypothetical protein
LSDVPGAQASFQEAAKISLKDKRQSILRLGWMATSIRSPRLEPSSPRLDLTDDV